MSGRASSAPRRTGPAWPGTRPRSGTPSCPGAGSSGAPAPSTPWPTCAGTGRSTTAGLLAAHPAGDSRTCCPASGAARARPAGIPGCAARMDPPVRVSQASADPHPVARAFVAALAGAGHPVSSDLSGTEQEGVGWHDLAIADGERVSSADGHLRPVVGRPNLTVETDCLVTGLAVRHGRCTGVQYAREGALAAAQASGEVILCAGGIGSPQLLMLSGIGPAGQLRDLGIDPVADLPGVGANFQDHPIVMVSYAAATALPASRYNHGEAVAALRSGVPGQ